MVHATAADHTVSKVLLEWINSFSLGKTIRATDELTDGTILWEILQDIDPQYFLDELPERNQSDHWVPKWQNLKHIHKLVISYIRSQNDDEFPSGLDASPDLKMIAENNSIKEMNKLLKLLLIAAISSPNAETYVTTLQALSTPTQEGLKDIIQEAQNGSPDDVDHNDETKDEAKPGLSVDPELQFEERVGKVLAENDRLTSEKKEMEKALEDLHNRLARLQENNDTLQNRLASTEDRLVTLKSGKGEMGFNAKALESKSRQQEDLIATQEAKITAAQDEIDSLRMNLESLRVKNQRYQTLQDDYDELKTERDQLARKANAAEKYRQKLQASQEFEKENQALKNQVKDLQQQLKDADSNQKWSSERDVELEEYRRVLPRIEQDRHEIQNLKKQLEFNNHALTERLQTAEEQRERDEALISELRERIRELEGSPGSPSLTPGSGTPKLQGTLQKDFEDIGVKEAHLKAENDDLKKEIDRLKSTDPSKVGGVGEDQTGEQTEIALPSDPSKIGSHLEAYSENLVLTAQLAQAKSTQSAEYWKLYDQYAEVRQKLADLEDELETNKRELQDAKNELGLVNKEKLDMLNEVKEANSAEVSKVRAEWDALTQKVHHLEAEVDASQTLTREVCIERDELRSTLDQKRAEIRAEDQDIINEMRGLLDQFAARANNPEQFEKSDNELLEQFSKVTEKAVDRLVKRAEHIDHLNELINALRERIKNHEEANIDSVLSEREAELQKVIDQQSREIALISSAWFDLQGRLQNSNVTVSRYRHPASTRAGAGADASRGWLSKQRSVVAGR
ncbi:microtubule binding protein HOOK3, putative [Paecilomyces variotii No. 5]|uniref:Microtubule binding protein HOOK3, putative n=1 Tax=Byssochlamys spectabilis (strain No. 5 / NBRC 109023) TaxID=1356009 RepID=V5FHV1_BYSSN|nr:microtubule binding protein HOOK3, putative [Paecilomyces variotii No. 5]